ncbi:MAG TPA: PDZ domain-containing protein, partial [Chitinophagaceae bacterium]
ISEGLSVYYEYIVVKRAGITTDTELLNALRGNIVAFENKPGKRFQTLEQASYETWSDGPFGRTGDEVNKTISYYDKGPAVGILFDFKIRQISNNKKSLDDVMRFLYKEYYQKKKRGFTEQELRNAFENVAGGSLAEEFEYITSTKELNYPAYFSYAGLSIDTATQVLPAAHAGFTIREREDTAFIANVDFESPAWNRGIRRGQHLVSINGEKATASSYNNILAGARPGDKIGLSVSINNVVTEIEIVLINKTEKAFKITPAENPDPLQKQILEGWLKG